MLVHITKNQPHLLSTEKGFKFWNNL